MDDKADNVFMAMEYVDNNLKVVMDSMANPFSAGRSGSLSSSKCVMPSVIHGKW